MSTLLQNLNKNISNTTAAQAPVALAAFGGINGGWLQSNLIADAAGDLFGTTAQGGASGFGTVFELVKTATGYSAPVTLATFNGNNAEYSHAGLIMDAKGDLFGTTSGDGTSSNGTVFELVKTATGYAAPTTLATFTGTNGSVPMGGLVADAAGDLFGTTIGGGTSGNGNIYELVKTATGFAAPVTLASFTGANGRLPMGNLIRDAAGDLFGTTEFGGAKNDGTVFELVKTATGWSAPVTLGTFNGANGQYSAAGLVMDAAGDLFGTTRLGGANKQGTVFELAKTATGFAAPATLVSFNATNGAQPMAALITDAAGDLFGTTRLGGASNAGTVFELVKTATGYSAPVTLASLDFTNGAYSQASLTFDAAGDLLGTATWYGANNQGTVFEVSATQVANALASARAQQTYTLTSHAVTISGDIGNDVITAAAGTLIGGDVIIGGTGTNTLNLTGGGAFNLRTPATLANIGIVNLAEGQASSATAQTVTLRAGLNAQIYVASGTPAAGSTDPERIVINGVAGDASTIHLGTGTDTVNLGSAAETIVGSGQVVANARVLGAAAISGTVLVNATAATAGALIENRGGATTVNLSGGGTATLNSADVGVTGVALGNATTAWNFTSDKESGVTIVDRSASADMINLLGSNATVTLGAADTVALHAGMGNDVITGFATSGTKQDVLQFDSNVFSDWSHLLGATTQQGSDLLITIDSSDSVLLKNVSLASFAQSSARFV